MAATLGNDDARLGSRRADEVIEIALLLPATRMDALLDLSKTRGQSIGQILRSLIERELSVREFAC